MRTTVLVVCLLAGCAFPLLAQVDSLTAPVDTTAVDPTTPADTSSVPAAAPADTIAVRPAPALDVIGIVRGLELERQAAMVAADTKALAEIIAEDATYVHGNGLMQSRAELFTMLQRGEIRYLSFALEDVRYRAYGGTVVGTGVQRIDVKSAGKSMVLRSRYTVVYAVSATGGKLVAYQSTPTPKMSTRP